MASTEVMPAVDVGPVVVACLFSLFFPIGLQMTDLADRSDWAHQDSFESVS